MVHEQSDMQPKLFEKPVETADIEKILLYALGDFQSRGKVLADRELAFDRLRGAFLRAFHKFGVAEISDEQIVGVLHDLGAKVVEVQTFVAKRPFRIVVDRPLALRSSELFRNVTAVRRWEL